MIARLWGWLWRSLACALPGAVVLAVLALAGVGGVVWVAAAALVALGAVFCGRIWWEGSYERQR